MTSTGSRRAIATASACIGATLVMGTAAAGVTRHAGPHVMSTRSAPLSASPAQASARAPSIDRVPQMFGPTEVTAGRAFVLTATGFTPGTRVTIRADRVGSGHYRYCTDFADRWGRASCDLTIRKAGGWTGGAAGEQYLRFVFQSVLIEAISFRVRAPAVSAASSPARSPRAVIAGCSAAARTLGKVAVPAEAGDPAGTLAVRWSARCAMAWGRFVVTGGASPARWLRLAMKVSQHNDVPIRRINDGRRATVTTMVDAPAGARACARLLGAGDRTTARVCGVVPELE